ncbi:hypothetical protein ACR34G_00825 [Mycoplasma sp. 480]|uniref:hypothetical protein n=1 Tax=Mycoplasma sp. 480 TaxID=3440155 RepID=UPI003F5115A0
MSKQLKPEEWKYWIKKYLANCEKMRNLDLFWTEYFHFRKTEPTNFKKMFFKEKVKLYNLGMNLESQTGKSPKKNKGVGRKILTPEEEKKIWDSIPREILIKSIKIYQDVLPKEVFDEIFNRVVKEHEEEQKKKKKKQEILENFSSLWKFLNQLFTETRIKMLKQKNWIKKKNWFMKVLLKITVCMEEKDLKFLSKKKHKIKINYRKIGRIMNKLNLFCIVRKKSKRREDKNT